MLNSFVKLILNLFFSNCWSIAVFMFSFFLLFCGSVLVQVIIMIITMFFFSFLVSYSSEILKIV